MNIEKLKQNFELMPVVAIIRGVRPDEALAIGQAIADSGIRIIEVPLNSPEPLKSIEKLATAMGDEYVIGAGTVVTPDDAKAVADVGGQIIVSPNTDIAVIDQTLASGLVPMPGWATASDAYTAYNAGARYLKLFPAGTYGIGHVKATRTVLPDDVRLLSVGGVGAGEVKEWLAAGIDGFGIGSELYKPGFSAEEVGQRAEAIVAAVNAARGND